jgi:hypothetical protein
MFMVLSGNRSFIQPSNKSVNLGSTPTNTSFQSSLQSMISRVHGSNKPCGACGKKG